MIAAQDEKREERIFQAAIQGIDLNKTEQEDNQSRFDAVKRRVESKLTGANEAQLELDVFGLDIEVEE